MRPPPGTLGTVVVVPAARAVHREEAPPPALAPWAEAVWVSEVPDDAAAFTHLVLPDGCCDLILPPRGPVLVAGPGTAPVEVAHHPGERWRGIRLRPGMATALLGVPVAEIRDALVPLQDLMPGSRDAVDPAAAVAALAAGSGPPDPEVAAMVAAVRRSTDGAAPPVPPGLGPRQARRRFTAAVGMAPKRFARIVRAQAVLAVLAAGRDGSPALARLAAAHGYVDQSHLAAELTELAGAPPRSLREAFDAA